MKRTATTLFWPLFFFLTLGPLASMAQKIAYQPTPAEKAAADSLQALMKAENDGLFKFFSAQFCIHSGLAVARYGPLNEVFRQAGFPTVDNGYLSSAISYSVRLQKVMLGLEGQFYSDHKTDNNRNTAVNSSSAIFRLGYCLFSTNYNHCFSPSVGMGITDTDFTLTDLAVATGSSASSLLGGPVYSKTLHYRNTNLALGFAYNFFPTDGPRRRGSLGIRADYLIRSGEGKYSTYNLRQTVPGPAIDPLRFRICPELGFLF